MSCDFSHIHVTDVMMSHQCHAKLCKHFSPYTVIIYVKVHTDINGSETLMYAGVTTIELQLKFILITVRNNASVM